MSDLFKKHIVGFLTRWLKTFLPDLPIVDPCDVDVIVCELLAEFHGGCIGAGTDVSTVTGGTEADMFENPLPEVPGAATGPGLERAVNLCCIDD